VATQLIRMMYRVWSFSAFEFVTIVYPFMLFCFL
jgi:hypothetical protein